jgi:hypothetical protein
MDWMLYGLDAYIAIFASNRTFRRIIMTQI